MFGLKKKMTWEGNLRIKKLINTTIHLHGFLFSHCVTVANLVQFAEEHLKSKVIKKFKMILPVSTVLFLAHVLSFVACDELKSNSTDELLAVVILTRHGDRTPVFDFPTNPYSGREFFPEGKGQLTNAGKKRMYNLGKWLRKRYDGFLPEVYSEEDIRVFSTDFDRTLMSASAVLAGLYPPKGHQVWESSMTWQPIPVHTIKESVLNSLIPGCPKYQRLWLDLFKTEYFKNVDSENAQLYDYLTYHTGENITTLFYAAALRDTLYIQTLNNLTLPDWAKEIYPSHLDNLSGLAFGTFGFNDQLLRLGMGVFFNHLIENFKLISNNDTSARQKFQIYSGHDANIASILSAYGAYDYQQSPYGAAIIFELRKSEETNNTYVNTFYEKYETAEQIFLSGCNYDCELGTYEQILSRILIDADTWTKECFHVSLLGDNALGEDNKLSSN